MRLRGSSMRVGKNLDMENLLKVVIGWGQKTCLLEDYLAATKPPGPRHCQRHNACHFRQAFEELQKRVSGKRQAARFRRPLELDTRLGIDPVVCGDRLWIIR